MSSDDLKFMQHAFDLAIKAEQIGEVPVGAVVVFDGEIVGQGWNQPILAKDPSAHAEIMALRDAGQQLDNYRLLNTTLYVTLEPCPMCAAASVHARVKRVVYAAKDPRTGAAGSAFDLLPSDQRFNHHTCVNQIESTELVEKTSIMLSNFFRNKRNKKQEIT